MKKRGISPLIATVLLIGFAIVLAALVFRWGGEFFKGQTEEGTKDIETVGPLMGVRVSLEEVKIFDDIYNRPKILVKNDGKTSLDGFVVRIYGENEISIQHIDQPLDAFSSKWFDLDVEGDIGAFTKVEVLPKANVNGEIVISEGSGDTKVLSTPKVFNDGNVVVYWKFDGDAEDDVNGINCLLGGDAHYEQGKFGQALTLDGDNDYADCGNNSILNMGTNDMTIELWVKLSGVQPLGYTGLIGKGAWSSGAVGYAFLYTQSSDKLTFNVEREEYFPGEDPVRFGQTSNAVGLNDSQWHHVAVVFDRDGVTEFFVDGISKGSGTTIQANITSDEDIDNIDLKNLIIGNWIANQWELNGTIDEVRISKTVRTF